MSASFQQLMALFNLLAPASGRTNAAKFTVTLNNNSATINLAGFQSQGLANFTPQSVCVDNQASATAVTLTETTSGWSVTVAAGDRRTLQFPAVSWPIFTMQSAGAVNATLWLFDWPAFPDSSQNPANASGTVVQIAGQPIQVAPQSSAAPYKVGMAAGTTFTIAVGGTAITAILANGAGAGGFVKNPDNATENGYVDLVNAAQTAEPGTNGTTVELVPGASFAIPPTSQAVSLNAATAGHTFVVVRYN